MDYNSPEIQRLLTTITERTENGLLSWKVSEYDPISFMTETDVDYEGSEAENFAQNVAFYCQLKKGRQIWLETYDSVGFSSPGGFPSRDEGLFLRGLGYYTLRFLSSQGKVLYRMGAIIRRRSQYPLLCRLADAVLEDTQKIFSRAPENDPSQFLRFLHESDKSGGLERHPLSLLMAEFYRRSRCRDFHLLAMACATGPHTEKRG